jgi:hypothetical protein
MYFTDYWIHYIPYLIAKTMQFLNIENEFSLTNIYNMEIMDAVSPRGLTYGISLFDNYKFIEISSSNNENTTLMLDESNNPIAVFGANMTYTILDKNELKNISKYFIDNKHNLLNDIKTIYEINGGLKILIRNTIWDIFLSVFGLPLLIYIIFLLVTNFKNISRTIKEIYNIIRGYDYSKKIDVIKKLLIFVSSKIKGFRYNEEVDKRTQILLILWSFLNVYFFIDTNKNSKQTHLFWFFNGDRYNEYDAKEFFILVGFPVLLYTLYSIYYKEKK